MKRMQQVIEIVKHALSKEAQLKSSCIKLNFSGYGIDDLILTQIANLIKAATITIDIFEVNFKKNNIGDEGAKAFFNALLIQAKVHQNLEFKINFMNNYIGNSGTHAANEFYKYVIEENNGKALIYMLGNCMGNEWCKDLIGMEGGKPQKPSSESSNNKLSIESKEKHKEEHKGEFKEELKENDHALVFKTLHIINEGLHMTGTVVHAYKAYQNLNTKDTVQATVDVAQSASIILKYSGAISKSLEYKMIWAAGAFKIAYDIYSGNYWDAFSRVITTITIAPILAYTPKEMQLGLIGGLNAIHALSVGSDMYHIYEEYTQSNKTHEQLDMVGQLPVDDHVMHNEI